METERKSAVVVVVEDEPDVLDLIQVLLALHGYVAVGFNHPYELKTLKACPDLFLVDIMLPDINGIRVARMLRDGPYRDVPMIAMSASTDMERQAAQSGLFDATLRKPFDIDHLLDLIAWHLPTEKASGVRSQERAETRH